MDSYVPVHSMYQDSPQMHSPLAPYVQEGEPIAYYGLASSSPSMLHWPLNYAYSNCDYTPSEATEHDLQHLAYPEWPLYAHPPVSGGPIVCPEPSDTSTRLAAPAPYLQTSNATVPHGLLPNEENPLDVSLGAPRPFVITPAEVLLTREHASASDAEHSDAPPSKPTPSSSGSKRKRQSHEKSEPLNQRKAYFRSVSENVGFDITDPDTITSHDKKRSYLECLEEYVQWLHGQVQLAGLMPVPLERVNAYTGLKNVSLRSMLVHKQEMIREHNAQKTQAEARFVELQNAVLVRHAAEESLQFQRHSLSMGPMS